jgi:dolichol-phosphate mannosyltransferase
MTFSRVARAHRRRSARFIVVGVSGVLVNMLTLYILATRCHLPKIPAAAIATEAATLNNFFLHNCWTYNDCSPDRSLLTRLLRFHVSALLGVGLALAVFTVLLTALSINYIIANLLGIGAGTVWYYFANSRFIWAPPAQEPSRGR